MKYDSVHSRFAHALATREDFCGNYAAAGAGATVGGGGEAMIMRNQNGVVIELTSTTQGASLKAATSGLRLSVVP